MKAKKMLSMITEKQLNMLIEDPSVCLKYPNEDDVKVKIDAIDQVKRVRSSNLLNAINYN